MASPLNPVPLPIGDKVVKSRNWKRYPRLEQLDPNEDLISDIWAAFLSQQASTQAASPARIGGASVSASSASIGATDFSGGSVAEGNYQILVYARITQAAGVSSSLTIAFDWVDGGVVCSRTLTALTGNTVTTVLTDPSLVIRVDSASPVRYSTVYASNPAGVMQYSLEIMLLRLGST
jgi:hypothetical protein